MSKLGMYLARATEYCAETRNLIEDVINSISSREYIEPYTRFVMLRDALHGMGFNDKQLTAFAYGKIPAEYQVVPVNLKIVRYYRTYVRVPMEANAETIEEAARKQVLREGEKTLDQDPGMGIEKDDILRTEIDWDGAENE
jgi:hypothetical protein